MENQAICTSFNLEASLYVWTITWEYRYHRSQSRDVLTHYLKTSFSSRKLSYFRRRSLTLCALFGIGMHYPFYHDREYRWLITDLSLDLIHSWNWDRWFCLWTCLPTYIYLEIWSIWAFDSDSSVETDSEGGFRSQSNPGIKVLNFF